MSAEDKTAGVRMKNKSLRIYTRVVATCSVCHHEYVTDYEDTKNRTVIIDDLRAKGYRVGKYIVCPDCKMKYHMMLEGKMEK